MDAHQKVLFVDAATGYYRVSRFAVGEFFGPVDLGLHLAGKHNSLNIGAGLLADSFFPAPTARWTTPTAPFGASTRWTSVRIRSPSIGSTGSRRTRRRCLDLLVRGPQRRP